jgi:predicted dehydrogenase
MSTLRVGVVGLGFFAQNHLEAWRVIDGVELTAVCDRDETKVAAAQERFGIAKGFIDADAMLDAVDALDIATTAPSHRALVEQAARAGKAVICQKPMAETLDDARAMVDACRRAGVSFTVHENFRFQRPMREIAQLLREGAIGEPFFARISFRTPYDVYANQPYLATDERFIILDLGIHLLDLARCFMGEARDVSCWTNRVNTNILGEDVATMILDHGTGRTSIVDCSYATQRVPDPWPQTLVTIEGQSGTIELAQDFRLHVTRDGKTVTRFVPPHPWPWSRPPLDAIQDSVVVFQRHWLTCQRSGAAAETSGDDNLRVVELVHAAYADAERRRSLKVDNVQRAS